MSGRSIIVVAPLLVTCAGVWMSYAQESALPNKAVASTALSSDASRAFNAPLDVCISATPLTQQPSPKLSLGSGFGHYFTANVINHSHGGFEPMAFRHKYRAEATSWDKVVLTEEHAAAIAEGFLDGARVRVYQAIDGELVKIRDSVLPQGGHCASGWQLTRGSNCSALKGKTDFKLAWDKSFQPNRDYWFCVRSVDKYGRLSEASNVVSARSGAKTEGQTIPDKLPGLQKMESLPAVPPPAVPPPTHLSVESTTEGHLQFKWDPVADNNLLGYRIMVSSVPPEKQKGFELRLEGRGPKPECMIQKGDIVFVDQIKYRMTREMLSPYVAWPANRNINSPFPAKEECWSDGCDYPAKWELVRHSEPVPNDLLGGQTCLKWEVATDALTGIVLAPYGGTARENTFYTPLMPGEYRVEAWVRGSGKAEIAFAGPLAYPGVALPFAQKTPASNPIGVPPVNLPLASEWRKVEGTFKVTAAPKSGLGWILLSYKGPGTLWIDNLHIYRNDADYGVLFPKYLDNLRKSGMRFMRTHDPIRSKWGCYLDEMIQDAAAASMTSGWRSKSPTFFSLLNTARQSGNISPWLQVEMCLSDEEWLGFAEWLCASYDPAKGDTPEKKPWAHKRWALGQKKPWMDEFPEFAFEFSNETWNQTFEPYDWDWGKVSLVDSKNGTAYSYGATCGLFQEHVIRILRSSPYWTKEVHAKTRFYIGAWTAALAFGADAARHSPGSCSVTYAKYQGNSGLGDPAEMNDFKRFYLMQWALSGGVEQTEKMVETEKRLRSEGRVIESGIYEYGFAYNHLGDKVAEADNRFARALPFAVSALDATLLGFTMGLRDQAFFTFKPTINIYGSHTVERYGAHAYPAWKALELYNHYGTGYFLKTEIKSSPRWDFPSYKTIDNTKEVTRKALKAAPLVSVYASANADNVTVFLISRRLDKFPVTDNDGFTQGKITLPFKNAKKITLRRMVGNPRVDDRFEEHIKVETIDLPVSAFHGTLQLNAASGIDDRGLPPASIFCYLFEGTDIGKLKIAPTAVIVPPEFVIAGEPALFKNASSAADGGKLSYSWLVDSNVKSTEPEPKLTFPDAAMRNVTLKVVDSNGVSDELTRFDLPVGLRFKDGIWLPWLVKNGGVNGRLNDKGELVVNGTGAIVSSGAFSVLRAAPRFRNDFVLESKIEKVSSEGKGGDPRILGGLVLASNPRTGLGFSPYDFESLRTHASLLLSPDGAVRKLKGKADQLDELMPAGSITFPAKLRLSVKAGKAVAAVEIQGVWKDVATFTLPDDIGLMPTLAVGSPNTNVTTMTVSSVVII